jgi:hypothetical protein
VANEPEDKGQFGDQGTRRISKEKIEKARQPEKKDEGKTDKK